MPPKRFGESTVLSNGKIDKRIFSLVIGYNREISLDFPKTVRLLSNAQLRFYMDIVNLVRNVEYLIEYSDLSQSQYGKDCIDINSIGFMIKIGYLYGCTAHKAVLESISYKDKAVYVTVSVVNEDIDIKRFSFTMPLLPFLQFGIITDYCMNTAMSNILSCIMLDVDKANELVDTQSTTCNKQTFMKRVISSIKKVCY